MRRDGTSGSRAFLGMDCRSVGWFDFFDEFLPSDDSGSRMKVLLCLCSYRMVGRKELDRNQSSPGFEFAFRRNIGCPDLTTQE